MARLLPKHILSCVRAFWVHSRRMWRARLWLQEPQTLCHFLQDIARWFEKRAKATFPFLVWWWCLSWIRCLRWWMINDGIKTSWQVFRIGSLQSLPMSSHRSSQATLRVCSFSSLSSASQHICCICYVERLRQSFNKVFFTWHDNIW